MELEGLLYPDVFCIPKWLGFSCHYISNSKKIDVGNYKYIFSEFNAEVNQLAALQRIVEQASEKVVVIPGPKEIFELNTNKEAREIAAGIFQTVRHVWAYSPGVMRFVDENAGKPVARLIPWPFNYHETRRIGLGYRDKPSGELWILAGVPIRFSGIAENAPHYLERCLAKAVRSVSVQRQKRIRFFGMVYTEEDRRIWKETGFGRDLLIEMESRKRYSSFLRFVGACDAVVHLSRLDILGRISFIAASLGKPGVFTGNVMLNRTLYPSSLVETPEDPALQHLVDDLLTGLATSSLNDRFLPNSQAVKTIGDFDWNANLLKGYLQT
jgi:hypothetical protein